MFYYQRQVQINNVPARLFNKPPIFYFKPDQQVCPICSRQLHVFKTTSRVVKMLGVGQFTAHHTLLYCPMHKGIGPLKSPDLQKLVPQDSNVAYNVIVEIGKLRFFKNRQVSEIRLILDEKYSVTLSISEIERQINSFIFYLAAIHQENTDLIKKYIECKGGYILHLDATCEGDSPKLVSSIDSVSGFVLYSAKFKSENKDDIITFLEEVKNNFGTPHAVISDMGKGIEAAVVHVFGNVDHFICHFHFLSALGQILFDKENSVLRNALSRAGISGNLKTMRRMLAKKFSAIPCQEIGNFFKEPEKLRHPHKAPEIWLYYLLQWILDYGSNGNGYGFPFDQRHLDFYHRLHIAYSIMTERGSLYPVNNKSFRTYRKLYHLIKDVIDNSSVRKTVQRYETKVSIFSDLREAFGSTPDSVNNGLTHTTQTITVEEVKQIKKSVEKFITTLKEKIHYVDDKEISDSYTKVITKIDDYGERLFADPLIVEINGEKKLFSIHRTNNIMEQHFRGLNYRYRRVHGNHSVRRNLENVPEQLPLVNNLQNPDYMELIFKDERKIAEKFAEIDVKIIRKMRANHKSEEKIFASRKVKKIIRHSNFTKHLRKTFASLATLGAN